MVRAHVARGGDGLGVALLQLCMPLLELHVLLSQEVKVLLELRCLVCMCARGNVLTEWAISSVVSTGLETNPETLHVYICKGHVLQLPFAYHSYEAETLTSDSLEAAILQADLF